MGTRNAEIKYGNEKTDPEIPVYGVNEHYLSNTGTKVQMGRELNFFDIQNNNKVCILGSDFLKNLFDTENPIDKTISIRGVKFKVVGILESKGSSFGNNQDLKVLIPIQAARGIFTQPNINYTISVKVEDKSLMKDAEDAAIVLGYARSVIFVPGYGLAVSQAQHNIKEIADILKEQGVDLEKISAFFVIRIKKMRF